MKSLTVYVGLDYFTWAWTTTKAASPVCVERADGAVLMNSRGENDRRGIARRVSTVGAPVQAAIESRVLVSYGRREIVPTDPGLKSCRPVVVSKR